MMILHAHLGNQYCFHHSREFPRLLRRYLNFNKQQKIASKVCLLKKKNRTRREKTFSLDFQRCWRFERSQSVTMKFKIWLHQIFYGLVSKRNWEVNEFFTEKFINILQVWNFFLSFFAFLLTPKKSFKIYEIIYASEV